MTQTDAPVDADPRMPRWVKAFGLATLAAVALLFVVIHLLGGGFGSHGS